MGLRKVTWTERPRSRSVPLSGCWLGSQTLRAPDNRDRALPQAEAAPRRQCGVVPAQSLTHLGQRCAAAGVVHDFRDNPLHVAPPLREVLHERGAHDPSDTAVAKAAAQEKGVEAGRQWVPPDLADHNPRAARSTSPTTSVSALETETGPCSTLHASQPRNATQQRNAKQAAVTHHAAQLGCSLAVVRVALEHAALAFAARPNHPPHGGEPRRPSSADGKGPAGGLEERKLLRDFGQPPPPLGRGRHSAPCA